MIVIVHMFITLSRAKTPPAVKLGEVKVSLFKALYFIIRGEIQGSRPFITPCFWCINEVRRKKAFIS